MKSRILIVAIICLSASLVNAQSQNKFKPEWNFGVGFGPVFSTASFDPTAQNLYLNTNYVRGFHGGISARYISDNHVGIIAELNYSQMGWEQNFNTNAEGYSFKQELDYLELPLMTHIYVGNKVRFIINFGPKVGLMLNHKSEMNSILSDSIASGAVSESNGYAVHQYSNNPDIKFDYGLIGGLGGEFRTGIGNFSLEGRYSFSLGDIYNNSKATGKFTRSANRAFFVRLTYYTKLF